MNPKAPRGPVFEVPMKKWMALAALAGSAAAWADSEWVSARIVAIDAQKGRVTLKHGPIRHPKMAAMTMRFKVADASLLAPYRAGDRVRFAFVVRDDELIVSQIERTP